MAFAYQSRRGPSCMQSWIWSGRLHKTCRLTGPSPQLIQKSNYISRIVGLSNTSVRLHQTSFHLPAFWVSYMLAAPAAMSLRILKPPVLLYCLQLAEGLCTILQKVCIMTSSKEVATDTIYRFSRKSSTPEQFHKSQHFTKQTVERLKVSPA